MTKKIVITTGGTGGHIFPAQALAEELKRRGYDIKMLVDSRFKNYAKVDNNNVIEVPSATLNGNLINRLKCTSKIIIGIIKSSIILCKFRPDIVVGFGGYTSLPICIAALCLRYPYIIHEQNAVLGKANKLLIKWAKAAALSFEQTLGIPHNMSKLYITGNPVRKEIADIAKIQPKNINNKINILIIGGSQGASIFNHIIPQTIISLGKKYHHRINITHQCRAGDIKLVNTQYEIGNIKAEVCSFFKNINEKYNQADLIISRSGATTIAELITIGRPAILVPIKNSIKDHQLINAQLFTKLNNAVILKEDNFNINTLGAAIKHFIKHPNLLNPIIRSEQDNATNKLADLLGNFI